MLICKLFCLVFVFGLYYNSNVQKGGFFMSNKVFVSHGDIILDNIYDGDLNLIKQDGGGSNWNTLYNLSYMGETCYAIGTARR